MFAVHAHNIEYIRSWEAAREYFETTSLRSKNSPDTVFLTRRSDWTKTMRRIDPHIPGSPRFAIKFHSTDLVTYCPDGAVIIEPGRDSNSDRAIFDRVLPAGVETYSHRGQTAFVLNGDFEFIPRERFSVVQENKLWRIESPDSLTVTQYYQFTVDRAISKQARAVLKDIAMVHKLSPPDMSGKSWGSTLGAIGAYERGELSLVKLAKIVPVSDSVYRLLVIHKKGVQITPLPLGQLPRYKSPWERFLPEIKSLCDD